LGPVDISDPSRALRGQLEALLFVGDVPIQVADLVPVTDADPADILTALCELAGEYTRDERGVDLRQVAGGWRLFTSDRYADVVERFVIEGQQARLTQAALETLAVVAYRQPVTRARVAGIRGVGVDGVFRTLTGRGLIEECGNDTPGGAHLYRTTSMFLEKFGINDLRDLPSLAPLLPEASDLDDVSSSS